MCSIWALYIFETMNMTNIVLFGPPGSGKGTQAQKLELTVGLRQISTGDLFRFHLGNSTELGKKAKAYMDQGDLVPDALTIEMLQSEVEKYPDAKGFIFDGFPRTAPQAEALDTFLLGRGTSIAAMILLEVGEDELVRRLLERGKTSEREDDQNEEVVRHRISVYHEKTAPVADFYSAQGKFHKIPGEGGVEAIYTSLESLVKTL